MQIADITVLALWGLAVFVVWSVPSILLTGLLLLLPGLLGRWRLALAICLLLVAGFAGLWLMALFRVPTALPLPTRPRAGVLVWPIMALWPALGAVAVSRHRLARAAPAEPSDQGKA